MPHGKRKVRKHRGSRTHGYGQVGQHRGGGQRGGKGKAGLRKHKWSWTVRYAPEHLGKHGFKHSIKQVMNTVNVGELDEQIEKLLTKKQANKTKRGIAVNLTQLGYSKLLGSGKVGHPLIVRVDFFSKSAVKKIREAGGQLTNK